MGQSIIVWDIETVPDLPGFAAAIDNLLGCYKAREKITIFDKGIKYVSQKLGIADECLKYIEPISKSSEEDEEAGELHEAKEVLRIKLPADKNATLPLYPGEEAFNQPAPGISPKPSSILRGALAAIGSVRRDHLDTVFA